VFRGKNRPTSPILKVGPQQESKDVELKGERPQREKSKREEPTPAPRFLTEIPMEKKMTPGHRDQHGKKSPIVEHSYKKNPKKKGVRMGLAPQREQSEKKIKEENAPNETQTKKAVDQRRHSWPGRQGGRRKKNGKPKERKI